MRQHTPSAPSATPVGRRSVLAAAAGAGAVAALGAAAPAAQAAPAGRPPAPSP